MSTMLTFSIFSVIFLAIGIVLQVMSDKIVELPKRYDEECHDKIQSATENCFIDFHKIEATIPGPIYVYYQLDNFYQNHRRYVKSRDNEQLAGTMKEVNDLSSCDPIIQVGDLWPNQQYAYKDTKDNQRPWDDPTKKDLKIGNDQPAVPCGLVAKSVFNDTFKLWKIDDETNKRIEPSIDIIESGIAWSSDKQYKFKNVDLKGGDKSWDEVQWLDITDGKFLFLFSYFLIEHFIVWMRTAGLPNFRKLWGRIENGLEKGTYQLEIDNQYEV